MERVPVVEEIEWGKGEHPDAAKPLSAFSAITATCNDCGHVAVLEEAQLAHLSAVPSFGALWRHAFCAPCREMGAQAGRDSVMLHGELKEAPAPARHAWSTKEVFGHNRSDPRANLPRQNIFDRRISQLERMSK